MNILYICADDMRADFMVFMPGLQSRLVRDGSWFTGARIDMPMCQPSRFGFITGQSFKTHGKTNGNSASDLTGFNNNNTIGKWLHDQGYRTALIGKYFNTTTMGEVPTGWDVWRELMQNDAFGYDQQAGFPIFAVGDGAGSELFQENAGRMGVDQCLLYAQTFISGSQPWFLYLAPSSPHYPFTPDGRDITAYRNYRMALSLETSTTGADGKPSWVSGATDLTPTQQEAMRITARAQARELKSLDRAMCTLYDSLPADTVVIFAGDNGMFYGEHRNPYAGIAKGETYEVCCRVPLLAKGSTFPTGRCTIPVSQLDITATLIGLTGATAGLSAQAGVDLRTIANNPGNYSSRQMLLGGGGAGEFVLTTHKQRTALVAESGVAKWKLIQHYDTTLGDITTTPNQYEMYDLVNDPNELTNLAYTNTTQRTAMKTVLDALLA